MTNLSTTAMATAADYADALLTARKASRILLLILILMVLAQLTIFFVARYTDMILPPADVAAASDATLAPPSTLPLASEVDAATTAPIESVVRAKTAISEAAEPAAPNPPPFMAQVLEYLVGLSNFLGLALSIVLAMVVLLIVKIMLVGRLIGVSRLTSAYVWCLVVVVLLFPWQSFLFHTGFDASLKIPGALYTWSELLRDVRFGSAADTLENTILKWARFVGFPLLALLLLLLIQVKTNRGLRQALGEAEPLAASDAMGTGV